MSRDGEKRHYNSLDRERKNIEGMDANFNRKLEAEEVLSYFMEGDEYFGNDRRINAILAEKDPEKRRAKIQKEVKKFFTNIFGIKNPEVAAFFVQYVSENMNLEEEKRAITNEVLREVSLLLGKEFGDMLPHKADEKYMNSAGNYMKKKGVGDFEKPGFFKGVFKKETEQDKEQKSTKEELNRLKYTSFENVLMYLSDIKGTGNLASKENKKGVLTAQQLSQTFKNLEALLGEPILIRNIGYLIFKATGLQNMNISTKQDLHNFLAANQNAKKQFIDFVSERARMGIDINELFTDPVNCLKRTIDIRQQIDTDPLLQQTVDKIGEMMSGKLDKEIKEFEKRVAAATGPEKTALQNALNYIKNPESKKNIIDSFRVKAGGGFFSRIKDYTGREVHQSGGITAITEKEKGHSTGLLGLSIGNDKIDKYLKEYVKIFDDFAFDIGMGILDGNPHIGVGAHLSGNQKLSQNSSLKYTVGTYLLVPYAVLGVDYLTNRSGINTLKGLVGKELNIKSAHSVGVILNASLMGAGVGAYWSRDKLRGIEEKRNYFDKILGKIFTQENLNKDPNTLFAELQKTPEGKYLKDDDKQSLTEIINSAKKSLATFDDFYLLSPEQKNRFISKNLKKAFENRWYENALLKAESNGWYFGGIFAGAQLWFDFFPTLAILPDFKKITTEFVPDSESEAINLGKKMTGAGARELAGTETDFIQTLQKLVDANSLGKSLVKLENGRIIISSKTGLDPLIMFGSIKYSPTAKNQIKYDGNTLVLGNIAPIQPYYENSIKGRRLSLYLGGYSDKDCSQVLSVKDTAEFANNNPDAMQSMPATAGSGGKAMETGNIDRDFGAYLKRNINKFVGFQWLHVRDFPAFMKAYTTGNYSSATDSLLSMIRTDKSLRNDKEIHDYANKISNLKGFPKGSPESNTLEVLLSQFANIMMIDANTNDKIKTPEQRRSTAMNYVNDIFAKNPSAKPGKQEVMRAVEECLTNPASFEKYRTMFSGLMGYQQDQYILTNSAKKLYYLLRPINDFYKERQKAFTSIAANEGLVSPSIDKYRQEFYTELSASGSDSWTTTTADNILGFYSSYKLNSANTKRMFSGFGFTPTGITEIAVNPKTGRKAMTYIDETDMSSKIWVVNKLAQTPSWDNFKKSMFGIIGVSLNDADFKKLLIDGNITIAGQNIKFQRKFTFFGYGHCINEGLGIEIGSISGGKGGSVNVPVRFAFNGMVIPNVPQGTQKSLFLGGQTSNPNTDKQPKTTYYIDGSECLGNAWIGSGQGPGTGEDPNK